MREDPREGSGDLGGHWMPVEAVDCPGCAPVADAAPARDDGCAQTGRNPEGLSPDPAKDVSFDAGNVPDTAGPGLVGSADARLTQSVADDLPDINDSPIQGVLTFIPNSAYGIAGVQWPAFEIHTPMASYWLLKSQAAIVSMLDSDNLQWINFSSGYRPNRGVPNLGGCCQPSNTDNAGPALSTVLDPALTVTSTHVRFISKSADESIWLVWDFFLTHFTLTINRAPKPFGFTYQGVPGGSMGPREQIAFSDGTVQSMSSPHNQDLPGPAEWVYLTHPANKHSLFLIQHSDDNLADAYRIADGDTATFTFGGGQISQTPIRFSLGLIDSCDPQTVRKRIEFVREAIH